LGLDYPASCPNLLSGYIHINLNDSFKQDCVLSCASLCLYVIRGRGTTKIADEGQVTWSKGDLLVVPYQTQPLEHVAEEDTALYYVHDGPLLKYLRVNPSEKAFPTTVFRDKVLKEKVESIREKPGSEHANRLGTLIGNSKTSETKTLTHTLWALLNVPPANSMQKPHR
jgi:gentisate 1,2-dioxygenase